MVETAAGQKLKYLLKEQAHLFEAAAEDELTAVATAIEAAAAASSADVAPEKVLQLRITALQDAELRRKTVREVISLWVAWHLAQRQLHPLEEVPLGAAPAGSGGLQDVGRLLGPDLGAIREVQAYVSSIVSPAVDPALICRMERTQGARLYVGAMQFAYFVSSVFKTIQDAEETGGGPVQLQESDLRGLVKRTRTQDAWAVATGRAGLLWRLRPDDAGGFSQLNEFSTRVTIAPTSAAGEFFSPPAPSDGAGGGAGLGEPAARVGDEGEFLSAAELVPMQTGALSALLVEGCAVGWYLRAVEAAILGQPRFLGLLTPRALDD